MRPSACTATPITLLIITLMAVTGCNRTVDKPAVTAQTGLPPPAEVRRAYLWDCGNGMTLRMENLYSDDAITLDLPEGPRRLPHVVSASGARYSDGSLSFWTKGDNATFERQGSAPVNCRELRCAATSTSGCR